MTNEKGGPSFKLDLQNMQSSLTALKDELGIEMNYSQKHWKIIEAAIRVFSEKGFAAGRTSEIAKEAGMSEGSIFNYFKTKNDLLQALLLPFFLFVTRPFILEGIETFLSSRPEVPVDEGLTKLAMDRVKLIEEHRGLVKTMFAETMFHPELLDSIRHKIFPGVLQATQDLFDSEVKNGTFRKVDSQAAMKVFIGMIGAHSMMKQLSKESNDAQEEKEIRDMIDIFLNGINHTST